jgi:DNA ligase (NAD+)
MLNKTKQFLQQEIVDFTYEEVRELQNVVKYHNDLYYDKSEPIISDKEYDDLFKKLKKLENKFDITQKISESI